MPRHSNLRVLDILDAIDRIASYVEGMNYAEFLADRKTQDAVIRNVEIIGEAARSLPADVTRRHKDILYSLERHHWNAERSRTSILRDTARCSLGRDQERTTRTSCPDRAAMTDPSEAVELGLEEISADENEGRRRRESPNE